MLSSKLHINLELCFLTSMCIYCVPEECRDGIQFISAGADCMVGLWSITYADDDSPRTVPRITRLNTFVGHTGPVYCVKYNHAGDAVASCGADFTIRLWNMVSWYTDTSSISICVVDIEVTGNDLQLSVVLWVSGWRSW